MIYLGIFGVAVTIFIMSGIKRSRDNRKIDRADRNSERLNNILNAVRDRKEKEDATE